MSKKKLMDGSFNNMEREEFRDYMNTEFDKLIDKLCPKPEESSEEDDDE